MTKQISTFLMFEGAAEAAMNFYVSLFPNSAVTAITRYGPGEAQVRSCTRPSRSTASPSWRSTAR